MIISNIPPFISDDVLLTELSRHGKIVSPTRKLHVETRCFTQTVMKTWWRRKIMCLKNCVFLSAVKKHILCVEKMMKVKNLLKGFHELSEEVFPLIESWTKSGCDFHVHRQTRSAGALWRMWFLIFFSHSQGLLKPNRTRTRMSGTPQSICREKIQMFSVLQPCWWRPEQSTSTEMWHEDTWSLALPVDLQRHPQGLDTRSVSSEHTLPDGKREKKNSAVLLHCDTTENQCRSLQERRRQLPQKKKKKMN